MGIATHAETHQFGIDFGTPLAGMLEFFQDHDAGAITEDKAIAILIPGSAGIFGIVIPGR